MPYRQAPFAIAALLALTVFAFWPGYYGVLRSAPIAFHIHGVTATIWLVLLGLQSWSIRQRRFALHRQAGRASMAYFPLLIAGMGGVLHSMSAATPVSPFYAIHGAHLGMIDLIAAGMVAWLYARALASRRDPRTHPRYMMATVLFLLSPILGRVVGFLVPALQIHGPEEFWKFSWAVQIGNLLALATAVTLYCQAPRDGRPFAVSGVALLVQTALLPVIDRSEPWKTVFLQLVRWPLSAMLVLGAALGALAVWWGWNAGSRRSPAVSTAGAV